MPYLTQQLPTLAQYKQGTPERTHKAYFSTGQVPSPLDLLQYYYYCYVISFLWKAY